MLDKLQEILKIKDCNFIGLKGLNPFDNGSNGSNGSNSSDINDKNGSITNNSSNLGIKHTNDKGETIEINLDTIDTLSSSEVEQIVVKIWNLDSQFPNSSLEQKTGRTYQELEFFNTNDYSGKTESFYQKINFTQTVLGNYYLQNLLLSPTTDINLLQNRQRAILILQKFEKLNVDNDLEYIKSTENHLLSYYRPETEELKTILDTVYFQFKILNPLNYNQTFLNLFNYFVMFISPFYGIVSPILFLVLPVLFMKYVLKADITLESYFKVMKNMFFRSYSGTSIFKKVIDNWIDEIESPTIKLGLRLFSFIMYLINSPFGRYGYLGMIFITYVYSIYNYFTTTKSLNKIINHLHTYLNRIRKMLDITQVYYNKLQCLDLDEHQDLVSQVHITFSNPLIKKIMTESTFVQKPSWFSHKGVILYTYRLLNDEQKKDCNLLTPIFKYIGLLDAWNSIYKCIQTHQPMKMVEYLTPEMTLNGSPYVNMVGLRNVCCQPSIENDLCLGQLNIPELQKEIDVDNEKEDSDLIENGEENNEETDDNEENDKNGEEENDEELKDENNEELKDENNEELKENNEDNKVSEENGEKEDNKPITNEVGNNMLLSGPNGSGKSTYIKSVLENIILAQTIGFSFCQEMSLTPFHNFITHLNIPDCQGKESLFQAEMNRCYQYLQELEGLNQEGKFSFNIIDEIFVSTNYKEGMSGAYAIIKRLGKFDNSLSIITTHFDKITRMNHDNMIKRHFNLDVKPDGNIISDYKIKNGINKKHMAIKLLAKKGFDEELIKDAEQMYQELG